ncbi:MAG: hypothetical protein KJ851_07590 [Nanoarchaeota archaeon]|nr:hypothetical protein [Nanoarchaeota archaeon]
MKKEIGMILFVLLFATFFLVGLKTPVETNVSSLTVTPTATPIAMSPKVVTSIPKPIGWGLETCGVWARNPSSDFARMDLWFAGTKLYRLDLNPNEKRSASFNEIFGGKKVDGELLVKANLQEVARKLVQFDCTSHSERSVVAQQQTITTTPTPTPTGTPPNPVPEFPNLGFVILGIFSLVFLFQRKKN